jgi:TorA maturation chaperone TorD
VKNSQPTPDLLRTLAWLLGIPDQGALSIIEDWVPTYPWLQPATEELRTIPLTHWQAEHTRLFLNGYPQTVCPPFESAYRHGCMDGPARSELESLYRQVGLEPVGVPADYLGTLLECAAYFSEQGSAGQLVVSALWEKHLQLWLPRFCHDLVQHSRLKLYRALGERLAAVVECAIRAHISER